MLVCPLPACSGVTGTFLNIVGLGRDGLVCGSLPKSIRRRSALDTGHSHMAYGRQRLDSANWRTMAVQWLIAISRLGFNGVDGVAPAHGDYSSTLCICIRRARAVRD